MVKRYGPSNKDEMMLDEYGGYVHILDYQYLQAALKEALDGWEGFGKAAGMDPDWPGWERISELRKLLQESTRMAEIILQAALKEALDLKEDWLCSHMGYMGSKAQLRIDELRKLLGHFT